MATAHPGSDFPLGEDLQPLNHSTGSTVLVIEDSPTELAIVVDCLQAAGYAVLSATDGAAAQHQVRDAEINLIVMDLILPDMNGYDLYRFFQADQRTRSIPIVMLTQRVSAVEEQYGRMLGAAAYLKKPMQPRQLLEEAQRLIARGGA